MALWAVVAAVTLSEIPLHCVKGWQSSEAWTDGVVWHRSGINARRNTPSSLPLVHPSLFQRGESLDKA